MKAKYISNAEGEILWARSYSYSSSRDLICETQYGNLSGSCKRKIEIGPDGLPIENGIEMYRTFYQYEGNKIAEVLEDNGKRILYRYLPDSQKISAKMTLDKNQISRREFYIYDASGNIIKIYCDNGLSENIHDFTGVTDRQIQSFTYHNNLLCIVEELEWDGFSKKKFQKENHQPLRSSRPNYTTRHLYKGPIG
ncbi:MAG: hypothetical protein HWD61_09030 [Parachlamydiaceae bacterium]|nr:MAG: hypothetical protein HWD61_09030 [Parachlamydiaceae bacterium]